MTQGAVANEGILRTAWALIQAERLDEANILLENACGDDPQALNARGVICARRGEFAKGVALLSQAVAALPQEPTIRANMEIMTRAASALLSDACPGGETGDKLSRVLRRAAPQDAYILTTSRCNLRCVYCGISGGLADQASLADMEPRILGKIVSMLQKHPARHVTLSGGEVTFMKDWMKTVDYITGNGLTANLICNGGRLLNDEELEFMLRFKTICFSIDTPDVELAKRLRPKVAVPNIVYNILRLRAVASMRNQPPPPLSISCVLSDANLHTLPDLVALVHTMGLNNLAVNEVTELEGGCADSRSVRHWKRYSPEQCRAIVSEAVEFGRRCGVHVGFFEGFLDAIAGNEQSASMPKGMTRLCTDPWRLLVFMPNGDIHTCCCIGYPPIAHIDEVESLEDIFFSPANLRCKEELLTGKLNESCLKCTMRPIASPADVVAARAAEMLC
ncbi:hypothetical protein CCR94_19045 [Rhodoblastus sphagnicola]|uniref:Radical SAM core domain-containing protein n=1 Tax=Rhodoblastus sphagnicola TaxID=333368 RepID=A0A2S6N023_9HYPH|nr:radical SAM protein [Rhodoblastus sphagnicola]MBB4197902.1 radical SAM protein with 4Fe4S-binding SPASM domain [Rhodoblastus sphagnicola]PPQ27949.1 hypothetical protein CCR94_19045 [Rhodoblastus sphagnicola]